MRQLALGAAIALAIGVAVAHDDGRYANSPLKAWFNSLSSEGGGACCSFADGYSIQDVDWETRGGHYRVRVEGEWLDVPDDRVVKGANRLGPAVVWPYLESGKRAVRCFLPGAES